MPTPYLSGILSRAEQPASGCLGPFDDPGHRVLACGPHYPVAPGERSDESTFFFEVTPQTAEGTTLDLILQAASSLYSEADTTDLEFVVVRESDLALQATATSALAGASMTYTATVTQNGPSDADAVQVEFFLPEGVALASASPGCTQQAELVTCVVGTLSVSSPIERAGLSNQATVTATVTVQPEQRDLLETLVIASSASEDPDFDNNYVFIDSPVDAQAQLAVESVTPQATSATEGDEIAYTVVIANQGPSQATDVDIAVVIPDILDITDFQVNGVTGDAKQLDLMPSERLTVTVLGLALEDSAGQPVLVDAEADAWEAPLVKASDQSLTIANAAPTAVFSGTMEVNEGEWGILTVRVDDPGVFDGLDVAWDLDNDGQFDDGSEARVLFDGLAIDGPATRPVAVRVRDDDGGEVTINGTVTIVNVSPVVDGPTASLRAQYDQPITVDFDFVDTSPDDTHTAQVDWGDGTVENQPLAARSTLAQVSHTYNKVGDFTVKLCVADKDGGQGCVQIPTQAACQEHGLQARFDSVGAETKVTLTNAAGSVAIPAGMPFTLYRDDAVVQTLSLASEVPVSGSASLTFTVPDYQAKNQLFRLAVDDNGQGQKTTALCSGSVAKPVVVQGQIRYFFPLVGNGGSQENPREIQSEAHEVLLPSVNR
ncbi:MAG: DUF11 domain-containing protein [Caldilineae bacterium]|nr:MAG: DUF11 domain-containing protein [Caldilineae bacterium]